MRTEASMIDYYARRAQEYERIYQKPERQHEIQMLREFVRQTLADRHVLEVACGTGYWTEILSSSAASVTAIDINEEVLQIARTKRISRQRVVFKRADAYAIPGPSHQFTGGLAAFWWSHIPSSRIDAFLKELHRVLAPGATMVIMDNTYVEGSSTP